MIIGFPDFFSTLCPVRFALCKKKRLSFQQPLLSDKTIYYLYIFELFGSFKQFFEDFDRCFGNYGTRAKNTCYS